MTRILAILAVALLLALPVATNGADWRPAQLDRLAAPDAAMAPVLEGLR